MQGERDGGRLCVHAPRRGVCLLVPYSTCAHASCLLRLGCGGALVSRAGWASFLAVEVLGAGQWPARRGVDPVWDTCWGWAAVAGGPGLSFMFGAREEESSQASGRVMGDTLVWPPAHPSSVALPLRSFLVALPALLLALGLGFLFCVRVDSGCLF